MIINFKNYLYEISFRKNRVDPIFHIVSMFASNLVVTKKRQTLQIMIDCVGQL